MLLVCLGFFCLCVCCCVVDAVFLCCFLSPTLFPCFPLFLHCWSISVTDKESERECGSRKIAFLRTTKSALYCCAVVCVCTLHTGSNECKDAQKRGPTSQPASHLRQHQQLMRLLFVCCCTVLPLCNCCSSPVLQENGARESSFARQFVRLPVQLLLVPLIVSFSDGTASAAAAAVEFACVLFALICQISFLFLGCLFACKSASSGAVFRPCRLFSCGGQCVCGDNLAPLFSLHHGFCLL